MKNLLRKSSSKDSINSSRDRSQNASPDRSSMKIYTQDLLDETEEELNKVESDVPTDDLTKDVAPVVEKRVEKYENLQNESKSVDQEIQPDPNERQQLLTHAESVSDSLSDLGITLSPNTNMPEGSQWSRREEKSALQNLNNRLAGYIDRVRKLQNEKHQLYRQLRGYEEFKRVEINNMEEGYNKQIGEQKSSIEALNVRCNELKVNADTLLDENMELKDMLKKKEAESLNATGRADKLEEELRNLKHKMTKDGDENTRLKDQLNDLGSEVGNLRLRLEDSRKELNQEHLRSSDLENRCQQLEADFQFKTSLLETQLSVLKQEKEKDINKIDEKLHDEYIDRLQKELQDLRHIYDSKLEQNKGDLEVRYEEKIRQLQSGLDKEQSERAVMIQEKKEYEARVDRLNKKIADLEKEVRPLVEKTNRLQQEKEDQRGQYETQLIAKEENIKWLNSSLEVQRKTSEDLQQVKVALDMEIEVFRSLLDVEDDRLDINDPKSDQGRFRHSLLLSKETSETRKRKSNG